MSLLAGTPQPAVLTLLSSTSKPALSPLWSVHEGRGELSFVQVIRDDEYPASDTSSHVPRHPQPGSLPVPVIHIQSPRPDTYIATRASLGVTLPYLGFQIKSLGKHRGMSVEVEMVDAAGRRGVVRLSSWKTRPTLHASRSPPIAHLPLALPADEHKLTDWSELNLHLPSLMGLFRSLQPEDGEDEDSEEEPERYTAWRGKDGYRQRHRPQRPKQKSKKPKFDLPTSYASTSAVRIYASCRVRRVWFSAEGDRSLDAAGVRDEWGLYTG